MTKNTAQIDGHYDNLIRNLPLDELEYDCKLDKGLAEYCAANQDIKYDKFIQRLTPEELDFRCLDDSAWDDYFVSNKNTVLEKILRKYEVDYTDNYCLIYMKTYPEHFYNDTSGFNIPEIYNLFLKYYNMEEIDCSGKGITSIPVLPKLKKLNCSDNELASLPELQNLEELICLNNRFIKFPGISNAQKVEQRQNYYFYPEQHSGFPRLKFFNGRGDYIQQFKKRWDRQVMGLANLTK